MNIAIIAALSVIHIAQPATIKLPVITVAPVVITQPVEAPLVRYTAQPVVIPGKSCGCSAPNIRVVVRY